MAYQELLAAIKAEDANLEQLGERAEMARSEWLEYEDQCEASQNHLEFLHDKLAMGDFEE